MNKGGSESVGAGRRIPKGRRFDPLVLVGVGGRNSLPSTQINFNLKSRINFTLGFDFSMFKLSNFELHPSQLSKEVNSMLTDKDLGIKKFILDRIMQIDDEIVKDDPEYKELGERPAELLKLVAAKLSPEDNKLLKEYDNIYLGPICRRDELIYSAALMDGILLGYWVAVVGQGIEKIKV
jgi:hypothetical protein